MAYFIPADSNQPITEVFPKSKRAGFTLSELYELIGCSTIECLSLGSRDMILDEEGKLCSKPRNERATKLAGFTNTSGMVKWMLEMKERGITVIGPEIDDNTTEVDYIAGDVLICSGKEFR